MKPVFRIIEKNGHFVMTVVEGIMMLFIAFIVVAGLGWIALTALNNKEIYECKTWAGDAVQYSEFYIVKWQKVECDSHQIIINAPVK